MRNNAFRPWIYALLLFVSQIGCALFVAIFFYFLPKYVYAINTPSGSLAVALLGGIFAMSVVLAFSRPLSFEDFLKKFNLISPFKNFNYLGTGGGIFLGTVGSFMAIRGMTGPADDLPLLKPFINFQGPEKHILTAMLLLGPILEEIVMRGFLYQAFREKYKISLSVLFIVGCSLIAHWRIVGHSIQFFLLFVVFQIVLCLLLESTRNLWNSIYCHVAYNMMVVIISLAGKGF